MPRKIMFFLSLCLLAGAIGSRITARPMAADSHKLADLAKLTAEINDLEATIQVVKTDASAMEKISPDFSTNYRFRTMTMQYKNPDKLRLNTKSSTLGSGMLIYNGAIRSYQVPRLHLRKSEDLQKSPGKRQSLLEYGGLLSPGTLKFMSGAWLRTEDVDHHPADVYELRYIGVSGGSYYRVWFDQKTHITVRRDWFNGDNKLKATFRYFDPKEIAPNVWLPARTEVRNSDGELAAASELQTPKLNQGLADSLFTIAK